jgi:hypothetical protein
MKTILEYFIILFPLNWELTTDYIRIAKKKKEDNHEADIPVRIAMCFLAGVVLKAGGFAETIFQGGLYSAAAFVLFDPLLNWFRGLGMFHKGNNSLDKLWAYTNPPAEIFVRLWILAVGIVTYYQFEETIFNFIKW